MVIELLLVAGVQAAGLGVGPVAVAGGVPDPVLAHVDDNVVPTILLEAGVAIDALPEALELTAVVVEAQAGGVERWRVELSVEWTLGAGSTPLYRVVTRGVGDGLEPWEPAALEDAFAGAVESLAHRAGFRDALARAVPASALAPPAWVAPVEVRRCDDPMHVMPDDLEAVLPSVVVVQAGAASGTGAIISPDGFLLTAAHVVPEHTAPIVRIRSGLELPGEVVRVDEAQDVALLHIVGAGHPCLALSEGAVPIGSDLYAIGSPVGFDFSVSKGIVSGLRELDGWSFLQTDTAINPGNSGGPLLDRHGHLVGVVSWKVAAPGFEGLGFGVPVEAVTSRLGLSLGGTSTADLAALTGRITSRTAASSLTIDSPDPRRFGTRTTAQLEQRDQRQRRRKGIMLTVAGAVTVGGTAAWAGGRESAGTVPWAVATATNSLGWVAMAGGGVLIGLSYRSGGDGASAP